MGMYCAQESWHSCDSKPGKMNSQYCRISLCFLIIMVSSRVSNVLAGQYLTEAITTNDADKLRKLLDSGEEHIDSIDYTIELEFGDQDYRPVELAIVTHKNELLKIMLDEYEPDLGIVEYLKEEDGTVKKFEDHFNKIVHDELHMLDLAWEWQNYEAMKMIIDSKHYHKIDMKANEMNELGETLLHKITKEANEEDGSLDVLRHFIENHNLDINQRSDEYLTFWPGATLLHEAVRYNNIDAVDYLLKQGADIHATDAEGNTPLHAAADHAFGKMHAQDDHIFTKENAHMSIQRLLDAGADLRAKNTYGETPLDVAKMYKDNFHRWRAPDDTFEALGFYNPDLNPNYEADMEKRKRDAGPLYRPLMVLPGGLGGLDHEEMTNLNRIHADRREQLEIAQMEAAQKKQEEAGAGDQ